MERLNCEEGVERLVHNLLRPESEISESGSDERGWSPRGMEEDARQHLCASSSASESGMEKPLPRPL